MMKVLFVNGTMRDASRTYRLARAFLDAYCASHPGAEMEEVVLRNLDLRYLTDADTERRTALTEREDFSDPMFALARQFRAADLVVFAAPYWDFSFPALTKIYIEHLCVSGLMFRYGPQGAVGQCGFSDFIYVTTAGGPLGEENHATAYMREIAAFLGNGGFRFLRAEGLDMDGADPEGILREACTAAAALAGTM